jgi:diguanylate cyclase (GGDEF)-like protein
VTIGARSAAIRESAAQVIATRRLTVLVAIVSTAGGILLIGAAIFAIEHPQPVTPFLLLLAVATLLSDATYINLRVGRHVESYTWAELTVVLGLALLAPDQLILTALCVATAYVATRRSLVKVLFNTTSYAIGVALAAAVTHIVAAPSWDRPLRSAAALTLGAAVFSLWNAVSVDAAIAFSQDLPFRQVYLKGVRLRVALCAGNVVTGLAALEFARQNPLYLLALPACLGLAFGSYRSRLRNIQERTIWRHLDAISPEINQLDETEIAKIALAGAVALLEADAAELVLSALHPGGTERVYACDPQGRVEPPLAALRRHGDHRQTAAVAHAGAEQAGARVDTCVEVPLAAHDVRLGVLRIRIGTRVKLTDRERRVLRTYAHTITTSIENARMYAEMRELAARNEIAAFHDPLTKLPNRLLLEERVRALLGGEAGAASFALMLIDLDHFKDVNDGLGHAAGDLVLCELADRLGRTLRPADTVCRLGGDEFAILLSDRAGAEVAAERCLTVLAQPIDVNGVSVGMGGSIGVATHPEDGTTFKELLHHADVAMYEAKRSRGTYRRYQRDRDHATVDRLSLAAELRAAIDDGQLEVHYQPQLDLATNRPVGAEALVRWRHPKRGLLPPAEFIGLVESSSLLHDFTRRVLDTAVAECANWPRAQRPYTVAVNLSARDLDDERLADDVLAVLRRHHLEPERLVLEITETAILGDLDFVEEQMARLANIGVSLSIDDFGTGHSSLTFLQRVRVHELKIDRSFVAGIVSNENDAAITRATVGLAQSLGLRTVAEGVEDRSVLDALIDLRCDSAQGYYWSPAVPAEEMRCILGVDAARDLHEDEIEITDDAGPSDLTASVLVSRAAR